MISLQLILFQSYKIIDLFFILLGLIIIWTFIEYVLHRFLFHMQPKLRLLKILQFLLHEIHHVQPQVKTRLVMPPIVSIVIVCLFLSIYYLVVGVVLQRFDYVLPLFVGGLIGYVIYDMIHYSTHHTNINNKWYKLLQRNHMQHHYIDSRTKFGVTNTIRDKIFDTK